MLRKNDQNKGLKIKRGGGRRRKKNLSVFGRTLSGTSSAAWQDASGPHDATYQTYSGDEPHPPSLHLNTFFFFFFTASFVVAATCLWLLRCNYIATTDFMRPDFLHSFIISYFIIGTFAALSSELVGTRRERTNVSGLYHRHHYYYHYYY